MIDRHNRRRLHVINALREYASRQDPAERLHLEGTGTASLAAWFLGPRAENRDLFTNLLVEGLQAAYNDRDRIYPNDPPYVTPERMDQDYEDSIARLETEYQKLLKNLQGSVPFFSHRYQAHMNWDLTMPGLLGYFAAMVYNQNNVALEASPITAQLEQVVGKDLCTMLGFNGESSWGHVTCDGSVANLEAMWAARNLKTYAISLQAALELEPTLSPARDMMVTTAAGRPARLRDLSAWELMNLTASHYTQL